MATNHNCDTLKQFWMLVSIGSHGKLKFTDRQSHPGGGSHELARIDGLSPFTAACSKSVRDRCESLLGFETSWSGRECCGFPMVIWERIVMWVPSCLVGFLWKPALHVFAFLWNAFSVTCFRGFFWGSRLFWDYILCQWTSFIFYLQLVSVVFWGKRDHLLWFC